MRLKTKSPDARAGKGRRRYLMAKKGGCRRQADISRQRLVRKMKEIVDRPIEAAVDRTKTGWVAGVYREFGRHQTTVAALYYFALGREAADYPICGGFVGEIRAVRRYHETDCPKLEKWVDRAKLFGRLPEDAILEPLVGEFVPPEAEEAEEGEVGVKEAGAAGSERPRIELWMAGPGLARLVLPVCMKMDAALISVDGRPTPEAAERLIDRARGARSRGRRPTVVFCLSDLSPSGVVFCRDLASLIKYQISSGGDGPDLRMGRVGLSPRQVLDLGIPTIPGRAGSKEEKKFYSRRVKPHGLDPERIAELDAIEARHPGGITGFVEEVLARLGGEGFDFEGKDQLVEISRGCL